MGLAAAVGIRVGLLEPAGVAAAGTINALSYILWSIWLIAIGLTLLRASPGNQEVPAAGGGWPRVRWHHEAAEARGEAFGPHSLHAFQSRGAGPIESHD